MTSKQEKMVNTLKKDIIRCDFYDSDKNGFTVENSKYEFKTFEVKDEGEFVSVESVVGRKDEDASEYFNHRIYRKIFISKDGDVHTYYNHKEYDRVITRYADILYYGYSN